MQKRLSRIPVVLVFVLLAAEGSIIGQTSPPQVRTWASRHSLTPRTKKALGYSTLIARLRARGVTVKRTNEKVSQPFFSVTGRVLMVNGEGVQIFEYPNAAVAESEARRVSSTGTSAARSKIAWIAPPHFYRSGKLIALYVGNNTSVLESLIAVLGPQFAGS